MASHLTFYEKHYNWLIENGIIPEVARIIASAIAYDAGEITISDGVKEKLVELDIMNKDGKINIKERVEIGWLMLATRIQRNYGKIDTENTDSNISAE